MSSWKEVVAAKLATREAIIQKHPRDEPVECSHITAVDDITDLTQQLKSGHVSAQDIVYAYISQ